MWRLLAWPKMGGPADPLRLTSLKTPQATIKKPRTMPGLWSLKYRESSVPCDDRSTEVIVEADAQDVVGEMRRVRHRKRVADRPQNRCGDRTGADGAEVHVEILKLCSPVSADAALDAGPRRPARPRRRGARESDRGQR